MSNNRGRSPPRHHHARSRSTAEETSMVSSRHIEAFGRTLGATANHLIGGDGGVSQHYHSALNEIHRELRKPMIQRSVFSLAKANPRELVRSNFSATEIQHRALAHLPDELLRHVPESTSSYSLFQGFQATQPEEDTHGKKKHSKKNSKGQKLIGGGEEVEERNPGLGKLKSKKGTLDHRLEMMNVRKNMCASEIREIDTKIANLNTMRKIVLDRLAGLEQEEAEMEHELMDVSNKIEDLQEQLEDEAALAAKSPALGPSRDAEEDAEDTQAMDASFMSESIYEKLPSPKSKRRRNTRRISMPVLHEHMEPGTRIRELQAHQECISAMDFDVPFGTMVTAAWDDTVRVWDINAGRCMGMLEGHLSSVRCLQVEDNIVATGSSDSTIRLWDLSQADYAPLDNGRINKSQTSSVIEGEDHDRSDEGDDTGLMFSNPAEDAPPPPPASSMVDCALYTLSSHVAEITALHMHGNTLVSGSADKTLRQWDLEKGRCVQTLDVLWAAAQASVTNPTFAASSSTAGSGDNGGWWRPTLGRTQAAEADFIGALQCFETALAVGSADGLVRLWDLRSGMVHRSLVGHTSAVTCLQFDDRFIVTGSLDRSIRIWDLRTGSIYDAFAYDNPVTSMSFDARRIVAACGEDVVKVYDKADGRHWDCGAGALSLEHAQESTGVLSTVERVRIKDGFLLQGKKDGIVDFWSC